MNDKAANETGKRTKSAEAPPPAVVETMTAGDAMSGLRWVPASATMEYAIGADGFTYARIKTDPESVSMAEPSSTGKTRIVGQGAARMRLPDGPMLTVNMQAYIKMAAPPKGAAS